MVQDTEVTGKFGDAENSGTGKEYFFKNSSKKKTRHLELFLPREKRPPNLPTHPQTDKGRFLWQLEYGRDP